MMDVVHAVCHMIEAYGLPVEPAKLASMRESATARARSCLNDSEAGVNHAAMI